ncbi:MAG: allophanate hydrolase subunit 2 family protein, partial [Planctomycetota bacterium]
MEVIEPGQCSTVQDLGRPGFGSLGVSRAGAADQRALVAGNRIVGNPDSHAGIEMMLVGA